MDNSARRSLVGPATLTVIGVALFAAVPGARDLLNLSPDGVSVTTLHHISGVWMLLALAWLAARSCDLLLHRVAVVSRDGIPFPRVLTDMLRTVLFGAATVLILTVVFDQPATGLITVSSVVIAVVGFALRNVISDLFSGIALGVDHPYRIGDWIETVQGSAGKVSEITWRTTRLTDRNGFVVIIPNGLIAGQRLINYSGGERNYRVTLRVPLDATIPSARAKRILLSGALAAGRRIPGLSPDVVLTEYGDGSAIYLMRFRVPDYERETACRDDVASWVLRALHCAGLTTQRSGLAAPSPMPWKTAREALLMHVDLFRGLDPDELADLADRLRLRELSTGQVVVRQGDPGDFLYVLAEGTLDVVIARDGEPSIRDRLAPGEVFGEVALLTGQPRTATISAACESRVYEIHREDLDPMLRRRPEIVEGLATVMAERRAMNARSGTKPEVVTAAVRDDLLARLRQLFGL